MKRYLCILHVFVIFSSCGQTQKPIGHAESNSVETEKPGEKYAPILSRTIPDSAAADFLPSYQKLKSSIQARRFVLYQRYRQASTEIEKDKILDSAQLYLQQALAHNVFPYWYGTQWDFNGITDSPQRGKIACGYFVSTTIKHCGLNLNRYKVAQQYSHSIVKTLCSDIEIAYSVEELLTYMKAQPDQLYVVGLDNHVGFILKEGERITFIHASFVGAACVESESADQSPVLHSSKKYVLGNFSGNKTIVLHWLKNTAVAVVP